MHDYMTMSHSIIKPSKVGQLMCLESGHMIAFYMIRVPLIGQYQCKMMLYIGNMNLIKSEDSDFSRYAFH